MSGDQDPGAPISLDQCLRTAAFYPDAPSLVEVIETHISWVFLTDRFVYKLKKPVKFEFVDFSTPELRHRACLDELRLNRRLSPNVYLDVLAITRTRDGSVELAGRGDPIDWVVRMRRLSADKALDRILVGGRLTAADAKRVADRLTSFYAQLPSLTLSPGGYVQAVAKHVSENGAALLSALPDERLLIRRLHGLQRRYLAIEREVFERRVQEGWIVEGHGDLRPEHIYLERPVAVLDCIEFSQELRTVDVADELMFLAMECTRLGDGGLGELVLERHRRQRGDGVHPRLLSFYGAYRACVRAKVGLLRRQQLRDEQQTGVPAAVYQYLAAADRYSADLGPPCLLLVGGLMGTGKSTLALALADGLGAELESSDEIRRTLHGASPARANYGEGLYEPAMRERIYDVMLDRAKVFLQAGLSVILDATFMSRSLRQHAYALATSNQARTVFVHCQCPESLAKSRIGDRLQSANSRSEARPDLYERQARDFEPPAGNEPAVTVDTSRQIACEIEKVYAELRRQLFSEPAIL